MIQKDPAENGVAETDDAASRETPEVLYAKIRQRKMAFIDKAITFEALPAAEGGCI